MSESKIDCPFCAREPGEQHTMDCPRFRARKPRVDWLALSRQPIRPTLPAGLLQRLFTPERKPSKRPRRWPLLPQVDPRRAMKPAEVRAQDAARRAQ